MNKNSIAKSSVQDDHRAVHLEPEIIQINDMELTPQDHSRRSLEVFDGSDRDNRKQIARQFIGEHSQLQVPRYRVLIEHKVGIAGQLMNSKDLITGIQPVKSQNLPFTSATGVTIEARDFKLGVKGP